MTSQVTVDLGVLPSLAEKVAAAAMGTSKSITANVMRQFTELVSVWPGSAQAPGWINLHVNAKNDPKARRANRKRRQTVDGGLAIQAYDDVVNRMDGHLDA